MVFARCAKRGKFMGAITGDTQAHRFIHRGLLLVFHIQILHAQVQNDAAADVNKENTHTHTSV